MLKAIEKLNDLSYKDRLIEEFLVLESRLILLEKFIKGPIFKDFTWKYRHYMRMQFSAMNHYFKYLKKRMDILNIDKNAINIYISEENAKAKILKEQLTRIEKDLKENKSKKPKSKKPKKDKNDTNKKD